VRLLSDAALLRINRAVVSGRIIPYVVATMFLTTVASAVVVEILSPHSFSTFGNALWWSATTVTTIGYGDVVPATSGGRVVAVFVMFGSVATVSLTTAIITASFVSFQQRRLSGESERHQQLLDTLHRIDERLERIEKTKA
jgi:voltage-gated potassium channel